MADQDRLMVSVSGVRGTIGSTLTPQIACDFGCAFAAMLGAGKKVVIGRDTRPSGPMLRNAVAAGLLAGGIDVIDLGVATTPGTALMTGQLKADGGVVITASHNPQPYNGIKFLQPIGTGLTAATAARLKDLYDRRSFALADADHQGSESRNTRTHAQHVDAVTARVDPLAIAAKRFKVVLDSINGAGCVVTPMLLGQLGCTCAHLNGEATGRFAHAPEPVAENLAGLCQAVTRHKAMIGFAQDPDADRLALVDEFGVFIGEEYTLALAAAYVLTRRKGKLATNLVTSRMIDDIAAAAGVTVVRAPTGEANVVEAMLREGCILGGEGGGGVIEPKVVPVRDSLVGIAYVLQYMTDTGLRLSQLVAQLPRYTMIKTKMPLPAGANGPGARDSVAAGADGPLAATQAILAATRKAFAAEIGATFNDADGLRIDLPAGWVCVRASNTEPILRIIAEAKDAPTAQALVDKVRRVVDGVVR
jgi:phosphomannomutase